MSESSVPPVDADVEFEVTTRHRQLREHPVTVLAAISCGGALGALTRYGLSTALPHQPGGMPWATLAINASGCLFIGVLMVVITDTLPGQRLLRPFLGAGVLGGYTTFSTYTVDIQQAFTAGAARVAVTYLGLTLLLAMAGVFAGTVLTWGLLRLRHSPRRHS